MEISRFVKPQLRLSVAGSNVQLPVHSSSSSSEVSRTRRSTSSNNNSGGGSLAYIKEFPN